MKYLQAKTCFKNYLYIIIILLSVPIYPSNNRSKTIILFLCVSLTLIFNLLLKIFKSD